MGRTRYKTMVVNIVGTPADPHGEATHTYVQKRMDADVIDKRDKVGQ